MRFGVQAGEFVGDHGTDPGDEVRSWVIRRRVGGRRSPRSLRVADAVRVPRTQPVQPGSEASEEVKGRKCRPTDSVEDHVSTTKNSGHEVDEILIEALAGGATYEEAGVSPVSATRVVVRSDHAAVEAA